MSVYSIHNVRPVIVATAYDDTLDPTTVTADDAGTIMGVGTVEGTMNYFGPSIFIEYVNAIGQPTRSDLIEIDKIRYARVTPYAPWTPRIDTVSLPDPANNIVPGQSYTLRIIFYQFSSLSQENQRVFEAGAYKAKTGDTAETIFTAMAAIANRTMERWPGNYLEFTVSGTGNAATLVITEQPQPWTLGKKKGRSLDYRIQFVPIISADGDPNYIWGEVALTQAGSKGNGTYHEAADLEWFLAGETGDPYRQRCWPYNWDTLYQIAPGSIWDAINLHYFFRDDGIHDYASEKQLQIIASAGTAAAVDHTVANAIIAAINAALPEPIMEAIA